MSESGECHVYTEWVAIHSTVLSTYDAYFRIQFLLNMQPIPDYQLLLNTEAPWPELDQGDELDQTSKNVSVLCTKQVQ